MTHIQLFERTGTFAENKDIARDVRVMEILPALAQGEYIVLDFSQIDGATQSFVHALISECFRVYGETTLDRLEFKGCSPAVREIILIVTEYMQEAGM